MDATTTADLERVQADRAVAAELEANRLRATIKRMQAELDHFKPEPMSQRCRDGHHNGTGDMRCINCFCLCHRGELSEAKRALYAAALDEAADDRDVRARYSADACERQHTQRAAEYRQARDELLEAVR